MISCVHLVLSSSLFFLVLLPWNPFLFVLGFFIVFFRGFFIVFFLQFLQIFIVFFLQIYYGFFSSSSVSSESQIFIVFFKFIIFFYGTCVFKTRVPCGKNISMSAIDLKALRLNFFTELEPQRLEMLFSKLLPNSC